jgi:hypothetical protein
MGFAKRRGSVCRGYSCVRGHPAVVADRLVLTLPELEEIIARIPSAPAIIGAQRSPWQDREICALLHQSISRGCAIGPVLLPDANTTDLSISRASPG